MKKYKFIIKPLFFIFNLLFAAWLTLHIEKTSPSDFSKQPSLFAKESKPVNPDNSADSLTNKINIGR